MWLCPPLAPTADALVQRLFDSVHAAARDGSCGFVALREDAAAAGEEETSARHVSQLLGAVADASPVALRFQGMRCVPGRASLARVLSQRAQGGGAV